MKKVIGAAFAAMLVSAAPALAQGAKPMAAKPVTKSANADKLIAAETKLLDAVKARDAKGFSSLVMNGTWSIDETGLMSNDDFVKMLSDPKADMKIDMLKPSDMTVIDIDANSAIVTYKVDQKGSMMGNVFPPTVYATTIWTNKGGKWQAVFHQESTAKPAKK